MPEKTTWKSILLDVVLCSFFVFILLWGIVKISQWGPMQVLDPIGQAIADTELTDLTFSRFREDPDIDTTILLVNISHLSRVELAQQINNLSKYQPKVIAIDTFFDCPNGTDSLNCPAAYDTLSNLILTEAITNAGNVVLVTKLLQTDSLLRVTKGDSDIYDSLERSDYDIRKNAKEGYASLETDATNQEDLKTCRRFNPQMPVKGENEYAFSVATAMAFDSVKTKRFLARNNKVEVINFRGNIIDPYGASEYSGRYFTLDWYQALDTNQFVSGLVKDRIVLMGFLGKNLDDTSWDDKFFTPLNSKMAGKSRPDMYGLVVHANIVSMILNEDYINETPSWVENLVAVVFCMITVALFMLIERKIPIWFDTLSIIIQLAQIFVFSFITVFFVYWFRLKLNLTVTLAALAVVGTGFELYNSLLKRIWELYLPKFLEKYMKLIGSLSDYISIKRHE